MSNNTSSTNELVYRLESDRPTGYQLNDFEAYADASMVTHWRTYKRKSPNHVHSRDVVTVVSVSNAIVSSFHVQFHHCQYHFTSSSPSLSPAYLPTHD